MKTMANTILVPTDFSSNALMATHYALGLARDLSCHVHIIHAHYPLAIAFRTKPRDKKEEERAEMQAREELQRFVETLGGIQHEQITHSLVVNNLVDAVKEYISEHPVSLVVMGTHGASGANRNTLGSATYDVAKSIHTPLLIVPENTNRVELNKAVFFTNYQEGDVNTLNGLQRILPNDTTMSCTLAHILGADKEPTIKDKQRMDDWKVKLEHESGFKSLVTMLFSGKEDVEVVNRVIEIVEADLTLLTLVDRSGFFERLFHKSLAKAIVLNPKIPVLLTTE